MSCCNIVKLSFHREEKIKIIKCEIKQTLITPKLEKNHKVNLGSTKLKILRWGHLRLGLLGLPPTA